MYVPLELTFEHFVRSENEHPLFPQRTTELCLDDGQLFFPLEVGTEFLFTVNINHFHTMVQAGWWPACHRGCPVSILGHSRSFLAKFLMGIVALRGAFLKALKLSPDGVIPLIIRTPDTAGQVGEAWRPSNQVMLFGVNAGRRMFMLIATSHATV
jgi:hypothetical protein